MDDRTASTFIFYDFVGVGEYTGTDWRYYLGDACYSVRQLVAPNASITLGRTFDPFGNVLQQAGAESPVYGFTGGQSGVGSLWYQNGRYYEPNTNRMRFPDTIIPNLQNPWSSL